MKIPLWINGVVVYPIKDDEDDRYNVSEVHTAITADLMLEKANGVYASWAHDHHLNYGLDERRWETELSLPGILSYIKFVGTVDEYMSTCEYMHATITERSPEAAAYRVMSFSAGCVGNGLVKYSVRIGGKPYRDNLTLLKDSTMRAGVDILYLPAADYAAIPTYAIDEFVGDDPRMGEFYITSKSDFQDKLDPLVAAACERGRCQRYQPSTDIFIH